MIVSHARRFIFLKTKKTAGSSVEISLSRHCGPEDIVLPISPEEDQFREQEYGVVPRNYHHRPRPPAVLLPWVFLETTVRNPAGVARYLRHPLKEDFPFRTKRFPRHMWAKDLRRHLSPGIWTNYLKVTIERNPWDKAISRYYWDLHFGGRVGKRSMEEHLEYLADHEPIQLSNWDIYAEKKRILVDKVILYENLARELEEVGAGLGIEHLELPALRAKGNSRKEKRRASEVLSDNSKKIIEQVCRNEIEEFGYQCP